MGNQDENSVLFNDLQITPDNSEDEADESEEEGDNPFLTQLSESDDSDSEELQRIMTGDVAAAKQQDEGGEAGGGEGVDVAQDGDEDMEEEDFDEDMRADSEMGGEGGGSGQVSEEEIDMEEQGQMIRMDDEDDESEDDFEAVPAAFEEESNHAS